MKRLLLILLRFLFKVMKRENGSHIFVMYRIHDNYYYYLDGKTPVYRKPLNIDQMKVLNTLLDKYYHELQKQMN